MKFHKFENKPRGEGNSNYLKIADGGSVTAVLRGEIHTFYTRWTEGKSETVSEGTPGAKPRFSVNAIVWDAEAKKFVAKTWDFGMIVYEQLADIHAEYPLPTIKVRISRRGTKLDTTYIIMPLLKDEDRLTGKVLADIEAIPLNILDKEVPKNHLGPAETGADNWNGF